MVDWAPRVVFSNLEELHLYDLHTLCEICHCQLASKSFSKVQKLEVVSCGSMLNIMPSNLRIRLQYLQTVTAHSCYSVQNVFDLEGLATEGDGTELLSRLEELTLYDLPELMHIWMEPLHFVNICNLRAVKLYCCAKVRRIFPPTLVQGLVYLEKPVIKVCSKM